MAKIERFEGLLCWQKARVLANAVNDLTEHSTFSRDARLHGQLQGAAGSVMHNIAEAPKWNLSTF
jgi:four helix bundle protein